MLRQGLGFVKDWVNPVDRSRSVDAAKQVVVESLAFAERVVTNCIVASDRKSFTE